MANIAPGYGGGSLFLWWAYVWPVLNDEAGSLEDSSNVIISGRHVFHSWPQGERGSRGTQLRAGSGPLIVWAVFRAIGSLEQS